MAWVAACQKTRSKELPCELQKWEKGREAAYEYAMLMLARTCVQGIEVLIRRLFANG
jgi:hypothetical protein